MPLLASSCSRPLPLLSASGSATAMLFKSSNFEDANEIISKIPAVASKDNDCKSIIDQGFREYLLQLIPVWDVQRLKKYVQYNIDSCRLELSSPNTPVILLSDIFDMSTLEFCENLFSFVELNVFMWKEDLFFAICKNHLLRMCNDLLRRLSRSQNTVFCGRILLFLAQFFPFSERSGLNIISEFNVENITDFSNDGDLDSLAEEEMVVDESDKKIKVDFSLYSKFWYLQNFFRCPNDLYINQKWIMFTSYSKFILSTLQHYKLSDSSGTAYIATLTGDSDRRYFAKFLTSQKLLELQLSDSNFRRYVLVQFLILFQYLTLPVKSKPDSYTLKPEQMDWIKMYKDVVSELIKETPPDGKEFLKTVEKILTREERWNEWKNKSCPEVKKPNPAIMDFQNGQRSKEPYLGDVLKEYHNQKKYFMGNTRLTKLWNHRPNNLDACRSKERHFLPSLDSYFEEAIMQSDPAAMIEAQYKKVNEIDYAWKGLRLLSQKCPYFFAQSNNPIHKMSDFLENMLNKLSKDKPTVAGLTEEKSKVDPPENESQETQTVIINTDTAEEGEVVNEEPQINSEPMDEDGEQRTPLTKDQLDRVSEAITSDWQKLGLKMGYQKDEIDFFANERVGRCDENKEKPTDQQNARYMLQIWSEDDDDPSVENLSSMLESLGMLEALKLLKST
ncbi:hypothetical protein V9T40_011284 [Parthenolecanium corni]|uniref:Death domain-containing protein n=1 Tax=Parthenolecanium corni TaxID=536013 RepID=A0AAN9XZC2_9HEMI